MPNQRYTLTAEVCNPSGSVVSIMLCWTKNTPKLFFCLAILDHFQTKYSNLRPLLSTTFPRGFRISKNFGHPTSGSGGKKTCKRYLQSEQTDVQTHRQTDRRTFQLIESIGQEGRCFENQVCNLNFLTDSFQSLKNTKCWPF